MMRRRRFNKKARAPLGSPSLSPIVQVRNVPPLARLLLFVRAGGHCEFDGCNRYLIQHHLTLTEGNFAEVAHIVAFRPDGPRGRATARPRDIHTAANLMLLCPTCHKLIDDHPENYSKRTLATYKRQHEKWIERVTSLGPDRKTCLMVVRSPIGKQTVSIPFDHMLEAVAPRYPISRQGLEIDLTNLLEEGHAVTQAAEQNIATRLARFFEPGGEWEQAGHLSLFALAPMPLLIFLGTQLSNKVPLDLYQRHRDTEDWTWKQSGKPVEYTFRTLHIGAEPRRAALLLSLSGTGPREHLPPEIDSSFSVYELTLSDASPDPTFLRTRRDLQNFRIAYQSALAAIAKTQGKIDEIHLFPAVPAPIAVLCGRELLPKVHPALRVYDYDKTKGGFTHQLTVNVSTLDISR
jgi:CBASS immunity sensor of nucleotide second messenger signals/HNH endonuclease